MVENEFLLNLSNITIENNLHGGLPPEVVTWDKVLEICGAWDVQALYCAVGGLLLTLVTMMYWNRFRKYIVNDIVRAFLDKFLFTMIAMLFVIIIVRMMRGA